MTSFTVTGSIKIFCNTMGFYLTLPGTKTFRGTRTFSSRLFILLCFFHVVVLTHGQGSNQTMKFTVVEEAPVDTPVGTVSTSSVIIDKLPEADRAVQYSMQAKEVKQQNLFRIDRQSGNIRVFQTVDREAVCPGKNDCILQFQVFANKDDFFEKIPISINVTDINDNEPEFKIASSSGTLYALDVRFPESSPPGSVRPLQTATDADKSEAFGSLNYKLEPESSIFSLDVRQNSVGTQQVNLRLMETLDREKIANYTLHLIASDGGDPPKTGSLTINVLVEDFNDNKPEFTQNVFSANFSEREGKGYEIVKIHARDMDVGKNGRVQYFLSSQQPGGNSESIVDKVVVDENTGSVTLSQSLSSGVYAIWVEARDMGDSILFDQAEIQVTVLDTDNNEPTVRLNAVPQAGDLPEGWVSEAEDVGQVVGYLTVEDPDSGRNGDVSCFSMESHFKLEQLSADGDYKLVLAKKLDFETDREHIVEVVCKDQGTPSLNATASMVVKVADENDNRPEFTKDVYTQGIFENNIAGDTVVVVTATDRDSDERGRVQYRVLQDAGTNFTISPLDGVIKTTIRFNREVKDLYEFTVLATDNGNPPLNSTTLVRIEIRDKNDVAPVFGRPQYKFHLYENREADSVVGNITVSDPDLEEGGKIKLCLVFDDSGTDTVYGIDNGDKDPFSISDDGKIFSRQVFDREEKASYSFYIVATDQGQHKLSSSVEAIVEILDVNDHRPTFSFPSEHNFSALANIPIHGDQSVLRVDVTDVDAGKNSIISYSIVATNASAGLFRIGKFSGEIVASRDIGRADLGTFFITVNASDQGSPALWENRTLNLIIQAAAAGSADEVIADQNVLIVVCIVCFTVIVSGGIFIALCVLRRLDRQRKLQYAGTCCPGNRSDLDNGINGDPEPQQYDLAPPIAKEPFSKGNNVATPYHQFSNQQGYHHQKTFASTDSGEGSAPAPEVFSRGLNSGHDPASGGRAVPLSSNENQRNKTPSGPVRQEDHHSTSSTETAAGDSGHGSDEELSNSLDHSSAQAPIPSGSAATAMASPAKPSLSSFASPNAASTSTYPHNVSYTSASSSLRGGQLHNPGMGSGVRSSGKAFPYTDRGSLSSTLSRNESPQFPSSSHQHQFSMTAIPQQKRKNSSVRFHPLVTDISDQAGQSHGSGKIQIPHSNRSDKNETSYASEKFSSARSPPPPPPPSRHPKHQHLPHHQIQQQPQSFHHRPSSLMSPSHPYQRQHSLLPPLSASSSSSSPLSILDNKRNMRLHSSLGSGARVRQLSPLSPLSRSPGIGHEPTEESDLNTTTSGSYSVASDDVECRLNDFGETADAYV